MLAMARPAPQPDALVHWMEALADPTRLRLLRLLERHELGVVELCDVLQLPQSTVSRHLKVLLDGQWLRSRKQATTNLYHMPASELGAPVRKLWNLAREQTDDWPTVQQDALRLARRLRQRRRDSQQFFAGTAGTWDKLRRELYGEQFTTEAMLALLPRDYTVADLGCGTGHLAAEIAPRVAQVIAIDNSPAMLKAARKRTSNLPNVDLRQGDLESLPIDAATCDAAMLILVLTYAPDPGAVIREMSRILKPNGKAVIVDLLPHARDDFRRQMEQQQMGFDPGEMGQMLAAAGLSAVVLRPLPPEPDTKGPALFLATALRAAS
jgi:ArsR family transcriptional regulator